MHKIIRIFRILFENIFINYNKYDKNFNIQTENKLMSFNVRADHPDDKETNWVYRRNAIIELIKKEKPSIICMQEVQPHMFKWLYKRLYNTYDCTSASGDKHHKDLKYAKSYFTNGLVIWYDKSKYKRLYCSTIEEPSNNSEKFILGQLLETNFGEYIKVYTTHYDSTYTEKRLALTNLFNICNVANHNTVYYCGDFNATPNCKEITSIDLPYGIQDNKTSTFNCYGKREAVLDFIFSNKEINNYRVIKDDYGVPYISDHYPIIINL